ncbi:hypothetical protein GCM10008916_12680 [Clostridium nitritogenes]|uniref:DUF5655 domain-containing protein n=1 Tax=Clostridium nitritogenes TaxID=83340 RepID=A0ABP3X1A8_9CLOT
MVNKKFELTKDNIDDFKDIITTFAISINKSSRETLDKNVRFFFYKNKAERVSLFFQFIEDKNDNTIYCDGKPPLRTIQYYNKDDFEFNLKRLKEEIKKRLYRIYKRE